MMQAFHELGHVLGLLSTGGAVEKVVLHPLTFSRTDAAHNPRPLIVVWSGAIIGVTLPLLLWAGIRPIGTQAGKLFRFFAAFCFIANGAYIGFGPDSVGLDTQVMLSQGCQRWHLLLFGVPAIALGLWLLDGTGVAFGFGAKQNGMNLKTVWMSTLLFFSVMIIELIIDLR